MWSYLQSFVNKTENNDSNNLQKGLGLILSPAPVPFSARNHFRKTKNSQEALQKVLERQRKDRKRLRWRGAQTISTKKSQEGLSLLLRKSSFQKLRISGQGYEDEDGTIFDEDYESVHGKQGQATHPSRNTNCLSNPSTLVSSGTTHTSSVILVKNGQFIPRRSESTIIESLRASLQVHNTPRSARTMTSRQNNSNNHSVYSYEHKEASWKLAVTDQEALNAKRNMSLDIIRQRNNDGAQKRQHSMEFVWQCPQGYYPEAKDLDLPPAVQQYLQDHKDILMRQQQCEELPPDFDVRSVISETRSMPDIKRSESPVARPSLLYNGCKPNQSKVRNLVGRMEGNLGVNRKRQVTFVDKRPNHRGTETGSTEQQIPVDHQFTQKQKNVVNRSAAGKQQQIKHTDRTRQYQEESARVWQAKAKETTQSENLVESENDESEGEIWQFKDILLQVKQREEKCRQQLQLDQLFSQGSLEEESLQSNYHRIKFNLEKSIPKKERRFSQNSGNSSISETRYQELLNSWKAKRREFVKRAWKSRSRRYGRQRPQSPKDQEFLQNQSPTSFVDLGNRLSIPEAQEMFSRLMEDDLQSIQSDPLVWRYIGQQNREINPAHAETFLNSDGSCQEAALSRSKSLLEMIEEGRQGANVDVFIGEQAASFTGFTTLGGSSSSDGSLVHVFD